MSTIAEQVHSIEPDQMPHFAAADLGLYYLLRSFFLNT